MCPLIPLLGCLLNGPRGVDVSTFNGTINWAQAADAGLSFAFAKASEGLTIRDDRFAANWAGMKASGLVRGAYHFFRAGDDGAAQADVFLACVGSFEPGDLPPVLDWETGGESDAGSAVAVATDFMAEVQRLTGLTTIIYTTFDYWSSLGTAGELADFASNPLWFASDQLTCPTPPAPWSHWLFWQSSSAGMLAGVSGAVDLDRFAGSRAELLALARVDAGLASAEADGDAGAMEPNTAASPTDGSEGARATPIAGCGQGAGSPMALSIGAGLGLLRRRAALR